MSESEWSDWQHELPAELQESNRKVFIPECLTTTGDEETWFILTRDGRYFEMDWQTGDQIRRWREIDKQECKQRTMHIVRYGGRDADVWQAEFGSDDDAFISANVLYQLRGMTAAQGSKFLKKHPQIRTLKPFKNRLHIHAGDWHRHWTEHDRKLGDSLDTASPKTLEEVADLLADQEATKAKIRRDRQGN